MVIFSYKTFKKRGPVMEVMLMSIFSAFIICMTVFFIIKVITIAYKRNELTLQKRIVFSASSIIIGLIVASVLPIGYQKIFEYMF